MTIRFSQDAKIKGAVNFIATMHESAGCDAAELKLLFAPEIIDMVIAMCAEKRRKEKS